LYSIFSRFFYNLLTTTRFSSIIDGYFYIRSEVMSEFAGKITTVVQKGKILISDGAWGTFLYDKGLQMGECPEMWNLTHRQDVLDIAKSYIDAGSDIILTNSFGGNRLKLAFYNVEAKAVEINREAAAISREAAGDKHLVMGSIGPTGKMLMMGDVTEEELYTAFAEQAKALYDGGGDAICIETMTALDEAIIAIKAARENTPLEVVCTFTFDKTKAGEYRTMMGVSPTEMAQKTVEAGAHIIGTNCGNGIVDMIPIVKELRTVDPAIPVLVHANAGLPVYKNGKNIFPETPEETASHVRELIDAGANIIGGCCGTTPAHITAIKEAAGQ
jgi:5-methyltetrahydrofolate--homocysteine methyltransferase